MYYKWIGALLIVASCGCVGFGMAVSCRREERDLRELMGALDMMAWELQYRLTPLPQLCRLASEKGTGIVSQIFFQLAEELSIRVMPDVESCMKQISVKVSSEKLRECLVHLGKSLGRFDVDGQLKGLESVRNLCRLELDRLSANRENRLRSYQTLGLCAGAALAILFV